MKACFNVKFVCDISPFKYFSEEFDQIHIYGNGIVSFGKDLDGYYRQTENQRIITFDFAYILVPFFNVFNPNKTLEAESEHSMQINISEIDSSQLR